MPQHVRLSLHPWLVSPVLCEKPVAANGSADPAAAGTDAAATGPDRDDATGKASETAGRASETAGRASEVVGRANEAPEAADTITGAVVGWLVVVVVSVEVWRFAVTVVESMFLIVPSSKLK